MVLNTRAGHLRSLVFFAALLLALVPRDARAQLTNATEAAPRLVTIEQGGRALPDRNGEVTLLRAPFTLVVAVPSATSVTARFSRHSQVLDLARSGDSLLGPFAEGAGLAEGLRNGDQTLVLADSEEPGYHVWFYESEDNHRFDSVQVFSQGVLGRRTVSRYSAAEGLVSVELLQARSLYFLFRLVDAAREELVRASIRVTFVDDPAEVARQMGPEVVATVGDRVITLDTFRQAYSRASALAANALYGPNDSAKADMRAPGVHQQVLERLVDHQVMLAEADRLKITVSDEDVMARIMNLPLFQEGGRFVGTGRYEEILRSSHPSLTHGQFVEDIRLSLVEEALRQRVGPRTGSDFEFEKDAAYRAYLDNARATLGVTFSSALISRSTR